MALSALCFADLFEYDVLRVAEYEDCHLEGRINYALDAIVGATGSYGDPPWSPDNVVRDGKPNAPSFLGVTHIGWLSPNSVYVDIKG